MKLADAAKYGAIMLPSSSPENFHSAATTPTFADAFAKTMHRALTTTYRMLTVSMTVACS